MLPVEVVFTSTKSRKEFLRASRASEFSHSLDPKRTLIGHGCVGICPDFLLPFAIYTKDVSRPDDFALNVALSVAGRRGCVAIRPHAIVSIVATWIVRSMHIRGLFLAL